MIGHSRVADGLSPEEISQIVREDSATFAEIICAANINASGGSLRSRARRRHAHRRRKTTRSARSSIC